MIPRSHTRRRRQKRTILPRCSLTYLLLHLGWSAKAFHLPVPMPVGAQGPSIIPNNGASVFPPESGMGHFNQDFPGIFPPVHRPLSLRHESQPARGLYVYEQPLHTVPTVQMYARMAVYALADGSVLAYNPIAPTEETLSEIEDAFGDPDHIIVPTTAYNNVIFVKGWAERFPRATFWGLKGVKLPGAKFTRDLTMESFPEEWKAELDMSILEGNSLFRECFMLHRTSKTVFAMDSLVEMTKEHMPHPLLQAGSMMAGTFGRPVCPTKALLWNRESCKAAISRVLEWDFDTVHATHGACPIHDAKKVIREEFDFLWN